MSAPRTDRPLVVKHRAHRAARRASPTIEDFLRTGTSMLNGDVPSEYGLIETAGDALAAASPTWEVVLRMTIVWDNPATSLDLERVLGYMRETGAAMVVKVEQLKGH